MFYLASSRLFAHNRLWRRFPSPERVDDSLSSAFFEFVFFLITYFSPPLVSHGTIGICLYLVWSNKEEETRLIDFDMCDQHEAIV